MRDSGCWRAAAEPVLQGPIGKHVGWAPCTAVQAAGQSPLGWWQSCCAGVAAGPAQENAPSWLWDTVEDFSKRFFPVLSKPLQEQAQEPGPGKSGEGSVWSPFLLSSPPL